MLIVTLHMLDAEGISLDCQICCRFRVFYGNHGPFHTDRAVVFVVVADAQLPASIHNTL